MKHLWKNFFLLQPRPHPGWTTDRRAAYYLYRWGMVLCAGVCMGLVLLLLAVGPYPRAALVSYYRSAAIMALNSLPVALLILLLYGILGRAWIAFLLGGGVAFGFSLGNFYKLVFRDDPLYFEDMLILGEARAMATGGHYSLFLNTRIVVILLCLLLGAAALRFLVPGRDRDWRSRAATAAASLAAAAALAPVYLDEARYESIRNFEALNQWSPTQNYISRGFIYPFFHSIGDFVETPPPGYRDGAAEALLAAYPDADIPEDRKISVIALMREAYADFSRYGVPGLDDSGYSLYHQLEAESYTGNLVTNIFAGGTVNTERCFLTGSYKIRDYRASANSYVWYLRSQGYTVEGSHPYYQWFYNRMNINQHLGFQRYRYMEDDYGNLTDAWYPEDSVLLPEIYRDFKAADGAPYFSFSVNVQSHGPYDTPDPDRGRYLTGNYSDGCKDAVSQYLETIWDTDRALAQLLDRLREDPSPVVVVTFGDHLPWMGDGGVFYDEMGMDVEADSDESFYLRYSTRYLIWANDAAKDLIGHDLRGEGPDISPCYLMNLVFNQLGWEGPGFMQAMEEMRQVFPIAASTGRTMTDGVLSGEIPEQRQALYQDFQYLQHYWRNEFLYEDTE